MIADLVGAAALVAIGIFIGCLLNAPVIVERREALADVRSIRRHAAARRELGRCRQTEAGRCRR